MLKSADPRDLRNRHPRRPKGDYRYQGFYSPELRDGQVVAKVVKDMFASILRLREFASIIHDGCRVRMASASAETRRWRPNGSTRPPQRFA